VETRERYQAIVAALEVVDAGICVTDSYGRLLHQNAALRKQLAEGTLALEQAMVDVRQAAVARLGSRCDNGAGHVPHDARVSIQVRTEATQYEIEAIAIVRPCASEERFIVTIVRERRLRRMTAGSLRAAYELTARETRVAVLLAGGVRTREIADALGISVHTARRHAESVLRKLGVHSRSEVARRLNERGGEGSD
jgi:DNA-binding CsgD family transcriptional regulator